MHFRINSFKISFEEFQKRLDVIKRNSSVQISIENEEKIPDKNIFKTDFQIGKTFEHALGLIYIQSLSSMLSAIALNPNPNDIVCDLCSAPGSKTTLLAEMMQNKGIILANEISLERMKQLAHNLDRIGVINCAVSNYNGTHLSKYFQNYFDKILIDPPCSALGSLQDKSKVRLRRNLKRINHLTEIQHKLLVSATKMLKVGGELVYSTCTTTTEENEMLIDKFTKKYPIKIIDLPYESNLGANEFGQSISSELVKTLRLDSDTIDSEGFFIARLKKIDEITNRLENFRFENTSLKIYDSNNPGVKEILNSLTENYWIEFSFWNEFFFIKRESDVYFISKNNFDFDRIKLHRVGMKLATLDTKSGWRLTSNAVQILAKQIKKNILLLESKEQLISYFNGQKIKVDFSDSNFVVVKYNGLTIGTAKVRDGILHSYFPKSRRMSEVDFTLL